MARSELLIRLSNDDGINPSCYQDQNRKVVRVVKDATGIIIAAESGGCPDFVIKDTIGPSFGLGPCNLPDGFKKDGLKIIYSGYIFDTSDLDICADFFELTDIRSLDL